MKKLLILSGSYSSNKVAGIAIRFIEIAKALSKKLDITLALSNTENFSLPGINVAPYKNANELISLMKNHDILLTRGMSVGKNLNILDDPRLNRIDMPMIFDLLCPFFFEGMESEKDDPKAFADSMKKDLSFIRHLAKRGDFFICANEEQRCLWLAILFQQGRITHELYNTDPSLRNLLDIVPFGLQSDKATHTNNVLKGVIPGINKTDKVVIWFGGIWEWLDPLSVVAAIKNISKKRKDVKLVFVGGKHPDPSVRAHQMAIKTMDAVKNSGLLNTAIFFIDWVPYNERANYLLESDIGIITHNENLETLFSWRTRVLDHLWAGLPTIITKGDPMGRIIENNELGITVKYHDPDDIEASILGLIDDENRYNAVKNNIAKFRSSLEWGNVVKPILRFCKNPVRTSEQPGVFSKLFGR
jgi:glycosyltransferase involved in cell wall biosynthesis